MNRKNLFLLNRAVTVIQYWLLILAIRFLRNLNGNFASTGILVYSSADISRGGTFPNEVIETIRDRNTPTIMGNYDKSVGNDSDDCGRAYTSKDAEALGRRSIARTNLNTTADNQIFLRQLPAQISLQLNGVRVLLVHSSPRKINEYLFADRPDATLERLLDMTEADVLVRGHYSLSSHSPQWTSCCECRQRGQAKRRESTGLLCNLGSEQQGSDRQIHARSLRGRTRCTGNRSQ